MNREVQEFNGNYFELEVYGILQKAFPNSIIIHNKELYSNFLGKNTQIDLILIDRRGVFVIEAKGWREWIRGEYADFIWTGKSRAASVMKVKSPVNQNFLHIRTLRNAIRKRGYEPPEFHNLVVVPDDTSIMSKCLELCNTSSIVPKIQSLMSKSELCLCVEQLSELIGGIH